MNYLVNKVERKLGLDLNHDGRIGGPGLTAKLEKATHIDFNRDGIIGGYRPSRNGGLIGKIEKATHIDINRDGIIGGHPGYYYYPAPHCHKKKH
ncbi:unnamed protein product [Adineta ricciae]|uniref:Uncharacterized protein n=1 Tax=Adineta ricciae TaxID=249248 RepID=A0A813RUI8_ADIRI|nr:unnamed protein product [Adineta ricciae]